ncbi:low-density lipoprotein receptor class A domain-containing protein 2 [Rattus norvegicus]|uniref:Low density lipoprotein receptor class A domain containing 2 n=2 Tax=Rattus norvegicus TaxID=10116 RepID=D4A2E6_RAT|nr:low-density lipoprotein receptor class A domain-containing protein 2 [Rattus norvegicus]|eukprot:XP_578500.2 PREDICTED: low-density lipoprotein receptor class A domain-containing protein 2 [Rattus norvegicus]
MAFLRLLPQRLLLLGTTALTVSALGTADLTDLCGQTWQGDGLQLRSHSTSRKFYFVTPDTDCTLWLRAAAPEDRMRFQFRFFLVYSLSSATRTTAATQTTVATPTAKASSRDPCAPGSYLQFYDGPQEAPRALGPPICGLTIPAPFMSSGPWLGLRLVTRGRQPRVDFLGEVTSFRLGPCGIYFRCRNGRCVPWSLLCDNWNMDNCGDGSDQDSRPPASCGGPSLMPKETTTMENDSSKPLTLLVALGSAAKQTSPAGLAPVTQEVLEGPWLWWVALASSILLTCTGLLWCCCCLGWLAWHPDAHRLRLRCCAACNVCHQCPGRVAPGGLWLSWPAFQNQGDHR